MIQNKTGIMMNVGVSVIGVPVKVITCRILLRLIVNALMHVKVMNIETLKLVYAKSV